MLPALTALRAAARHHAGAAARGRMLSQPIERTLSAQPAQPKQQLVSLRHFRTPDAAALLPTCSGRAHPQHAVRLPSICHAQPLSRQSEPDARSQQPLWRAAQAQRASVAVLATAEEETSAKPASRSRSQRPKRSKSKAQAAHAPGDPEGVPKKQKKTRVDKKKAAKLLRATNKKKRKQGSRAVSSPAWRSAKEVGEHMPSLRQRHRSRPGALPPSLSAGALHVRSCSQLASSSLQRCNLFSLASRLMQSHASPHHVVTGSSAGAEL